MNLLIIEDRHILGNPLFNQPIQDALAKFLFLGHRTISSTLTGAPVHLDDCELIMAKEENHSIEEIDSLVFRHLRRSIPLIYIGKNGKFKERPRGLKVFLVDCDSVRKSPIEIDWLSAFGMVKENLTCSRKTCLDILRDIPKRHGLLFFDKNKLSCELQSIENQAENLSVIFWESFYKAVLEKI